MEKSETIGAVQRLPHFVEIGGKEVLVLGGDMPEKYHTWKRKAEDNSGMYLLCKILLVLKAKPETMSAYLPEEWPEIVKKVNSMEEFQWESL
jgi:hypothetical protein